MTLALAKHGSFSKFLSGFTSDHAYQSAKVETYDENGNGCGISGMTWNLLNRGHAASDSRPSNNPFNLEEDEKSYLKRKRHQLKFIWHTIKKGELEYVNLQEVDIFYLEPRPAWVKLFLQTLHTSGWQVVATGKSDNMKHALVMLFNANKMRLMGHRPVFPTHNAGANTGLEATFFYSGMEICVVNVHLDANTDHREDIIKYQLQQVADKKFTVIAGDTNPGPGVEYYNFTGDESFPDTVVSADEDDGSQEVVE